MTAPPRSRPWRRRKPAWAAATVLLILAYPASAGPAFYGVARDWIDKEGWDAVYLPLLEASPPSVKPLFQDYLEWWGERGWRDLISAGLI